MNKLNASIRSMRLRTLPLSLAGVGLGLMLAAADYRISPLVALLVVLTTASLQILSNLSNELGDVLRGTDTPDRLGPAYGLNGGILSIGEMKGLIALFVVLCIGFGTATTTLRCCLWLRLEQSSNPREKSRQENCDVSTF